METAGIRFVTRSPNYVGYLVGIIFAQDLLGKGPRVVAINVRGRELVLDQYPSMRMARQARSNLEDELQQLGWAAWCERYDIPASFSHR
jgi:hypothetical protein